MHPRAIARSSVLAAVAVVAVSVLLIGCRGTTPSASPASPVASRTIDPGITEWGGDTVEAAGYVTWVDVEGGFWAILDRVPQSSTDRPRTVAVLLPGTVTEDAIAGLQGRYVVVSGRMQGGASIRMSGPEVVVDTIAVAQPASGR